MEYDGVIVSFHRSYSEYADFKRWIKQMPFIDASRLDSFLIDLNDKVHHRYLTFSYLAKHILQNSKHVQGLTSSAQIALFDKRTHFEKASFRNKHYL
jgi:hypothetical protein